MKVTPTNIPWRAMPFGKDSNMGVGGETIYGPDNLRIGEIYFTPARTQAAHESNAAFIIKAVNHHDKLVAALDSILGDAADYAREYQRYSDMDEERAKATATLDRIQEIRDMLKGVRQ